VDVTDGDGVIVGDCVGRGVKDCVGEGNGCGDIVGTRDAPASAGEEVSLRPAVNNLGLRKMSSASPIINARIKTRLRSIH
jgi:hypothetical protein